MIEKALIFIFVCFLNRIPYISLVMYYLCWKFCATEIIYVMELLFKILTAYLNIYLLFKYENLKSFPNKSFEERVA